MLRGTKFGRLGAKSPSQQKRQNAAGERRTVTRLPKSEPAQLETVAFV